MAVGAIGMLVIGVLGLVRWPKSQFPSADEALAKARGMGPYETIGRMYVNFTLPALAIAGLFWFIGPTYMTWFMAGFGAVMPLLSGLLAWHRQRHSSRAIATSV
ncbi:MAG: hypothetical protein AAGB29_12135 [Planctomycetota bacterium]